MGSLLITRTVSLSGEFTSALDLTTPTEPVGITESQRLTNGTGSNQANQFFSDRRVLAATSENLDFAGGLTDAFGNVLTFTKVKELLIVNRATTTLFHLLLYGNFLGNQVMNSSSTKVSIDPGGIFLIASPIDGYAVTAGTGDILTVDAGSNSVTYDIVIVGTV